jgi:hypothetical protein
MKSRVIIILGVLSMVLLSCKENPKYTEFHPGQIWEDNNGIHINAHGGGILFHEGIYYWYGEHKIEGKKGNKAWVGVHCYSSTDLYNWKDEGIALPVVENDTLHDLAAGCVLERPKVIYNSKTDKFVMWFHLELRGQGYDAARSGVAVSDSPTGPFEFTGSFRPNAGSWPRNAQEYHKLPVADTIKDKYCGGLGCLPAHPDTLNLLGRDFEGGQMARDMNLFVDEDGTAYHIYSSEENSTMHISRLSDDYLSYAGDFARFFPGRYYEAPAMMKTSDGRYFLIGSDCTGWDPNEARYAVATSIWGPWTELGNPCVGPGAELTFHSQSTYILPVQGKKDAFIFMADRWQPENAIDGRYIWLPIQVKENRLVIEWLDVWDLGVFGK